MKTGSITFLYCGSILQAVLTVCGHGVFGNWDRALLSRVLAILVCRPLRWYAPGSQYRISFSTRKTVWLPGGGALFTDMGNIWYVKSPSRPDDQVFSFNRLGKRYRRWCGNRFQNWCASLLSVLIILSKQKTQTRRRIKWMQNKWFGYKRIRDADQFQLAISYPLCFDLFYFSSNASMLIASFTWNSPILVRQRLLR